MWTFKKDLLIFSYIATLRCKVTFLRFFHALYCSICKSKISLKCKHVNNLVICLKFGRLMKCALS